MAGAEPDPARWTARAMQVEMWLAERDGALVGFAGVADDLLDLLFVHPDHMGQGVGGRLHDQVVMRARSNGLSRLRTEASHVARPFFEARGWETIRENRVQRRGVWLGNTTLHLAIA